jgi:hypothetical protein
MPLMVPELLAGGDVDVISNHNIVGSATPWTAVPGHATTANTYGAVTQLISAAANVHHNWGIEIAITNTGASATASEAMLDILIGGATDDVLISSLICGYAYGAAYASYFFPVHVPKGVRIAAQLSSVRTGITAQVLCRLFGGTAVPPWPVGSKVYTYGTKVNNSRGVTVVPAASGATALATLITANTTVEHFYSLPGFQVETDTTVTPAGAVNIGIGEGPATEERIGTWDFLKTTEEYWAGPVPEMGAFRNLAAARRIALLASNSGANDAAYGGLIYCV